jgi:hypothetical protein
MTDKSKFQYYKVEGPNLELLKAYKDEIDALVDDREKLEMEFAERFRQQAEYHQANLRSLWQRLSASVGLDPDKTWGRPEYQIETRYLDDGFGAITYTPQAVDPLQGLLGGGPVDQPEDPVSDIPDKVTKH